MEEGGTAAAGQAAGGAFDDPRLVDQLFDDRRNSAALQAAEAGEIGAGDGLAGANEVEDDAAVDVTHHFTGRAPNALGVDHSHLAIYCRRMDSFLGDASNSTGKTLNYD